MILVALGANLPGPYGGPERAFALAKVRLGDLGVHVVDSSGIWRSAPVPPSDQPWYKNSVVSVRTERSAKQLLHLLHQVEKEYGRVRTVKNAPRILDLDLLSFHEEICERGGIRLPHPRLHERSFVLYPLREIAPTWRHPVSGRSVDELIENLPPGQAIERLEASAA